MTNFQTIVETLGVRYLDIANHLCLAKQTVYDWRSGLRKIPKKHHERLSSFLYINQRFLDSNLKEITTGDKVEMLESHLSKKLGREIEIKFKEDGDI